METRNYVANATRAGATTEKLHTIEKFRRVAAAGRQHTVQLMMIMGDYFKVGFMMNAVDQHLPPERKPLLPPMTRP